MADRAWALGDHIDIWCRYCRLNLNGVVAAIVDGKVVKVQCRTCRHFQDYKEPVPDSVRREKLLKRAMRIAQQRNHGPSRVEREAASRQSLSPEAVAQRMWQEATRDAHPLKTKVYDEHRRFAVGDLVSDKALGLGVVQEAEDESVTILFRDGFHKLPHNRQREEE